MEKCICKFDVRSGTLGYVKYFDFFMYNTWGGEYAAFITYLNDSDVP